MVSFQRILNTKSTLSQKLKIGKLFFHRFQNITHLLGPKTTYGPFFRGGITLNILSVIINSIYVYFDYWQQTSTPQAYISRQSRPLHSNGRLRNAHLYPDESKTRLKDSFELGLEFQKIPSNWDLNFKRFLWIGTCNKNRGQVGYRLLLDISPRLLYRFLFFLLKNKVCN